MAHPTRLSERANPAMSLRYKTPLNMALSPDGKYAAVVMGVYGRPQKLVVIPLADPTKEYPLAKDDAECSPPSWSPDGTRIAVIREYNQGVSFGRKRTMRKLEIYKIGTPPAPPTKPG